MEHIEEEILQDAKTRARRQRNEAWGKRLLVLLDTAIAVSALWALVVFGPWWIGYSVWHWSLFLAVMAAFAFTGYATVFKRRALRRSQVRIPALLGVAGVIVLFGILEGVTKEAALEGVRYSANRSGYLLVNGWIRNTGEYRVKRCTVRVDLHNVRASGASFQAGSFFKTSGWNIFGSKERRSEAGRASLPWHIREEALFKGGIAPRCRRPFSMRVPYDRPLTNPHLSYQVWCY